MSRPKTTIAREFLQAVEEQQHLERRAAQHQMLADEDKLVLMEEIIANQDDLSGLAEELEHVDA